MRVQFYLTGHEEALVAGYAEDRHLSASELAKSALLSLVRKDASRSGLMAAIRAVVRLEVENALAAHAQVREAIPCCGPDGLRPEKAQDGGTK